MNRSLLSFIVPVYNKEKYLQDCIESIVSDDAEVNRQIEILLIDDASCDGSKDICDDFGRKYSNVFCWHLSENIGVGGARNEGIKRANGKYCFFLDADDTVRTELLPYVLNILNGEREYPVICFVKQLAHLGNMTQELPKCETAIDEMLEIMPMILMWPLWNHIFDLDFIRSNHFFSPDERAAEDAFLVTQVMLAAEKCFCVDEIFCHYRWFTPGSLSNEGSKYPMRHKGVARYLTLLEEQESCLQSGAKKQAVHKAMEYARLMLFFDMVPAEHGPEVDRLYEAQKAFANQIRGIRDKEGRSIILCPACRLSSYVQVLLEAHGVSIGGFADNFLGRTGYEGVMRQGYSVKLVKELDMSGEYVCICYWHPLTDILSDQLVEMGMQKGVDFCAAWDRMREAGADERGWFSGLCFTGDDERSGEYKKEWE